MRTLVERTQALIDNPKFRVTDTVASLLLARIAELEKERDVLAIALDNCMTVEKMEIHNLEQQAKGISDFVSSIEGFSEGYIQALKEDK
jgi:hypothetical protein